MTFAFWTILVMIGLAPLTVLAAKLHPEMDNRAPRRFLETRTGWRQRLDWAHRNHYEALPGFAAAVIVAHLAGASQGFADAAAAIFILARLAYTAAYAADLATIRSIAWGVGFLCVAGLFAAGAVGW